MLLWRDWTLCRFRQAIDFLAELFAKGFSTGSLRALQRDGIIGWQLPFAGKANPSDPRFNVSAGSDCAKPGNFKILYAVGPSPFQVDGRLAFVLLEGINAGSVCIHSRFWGISGRDA